MLTVTPTAADVISRIVGASDLPDTGGLRITSFTPDDGPAPPGFGAELVPGPQELDQTIAEGEAHVYVEAEVAPQLDEAVLDATVEGDQVTFVIANQDDA